MKNVLWVVLALLAFPITIMFCAIVRNMHFLLLGYGWTPIAVEITMFLSLALTVGAVGALTVWKTHD